MNVAAAELIGLGARIGPIVRRSHQIRNVLVVAEQGVHSCPAVAEAAVP